MFRCRDCGEPVIRARTEHLKWQLLNPVPDPAGNVHAYQANGNNWYARSVPPRTPAALPDQLYMPHAATCNTEKPAPITRTPEPPPGVTSLQKWKAARAEHSKAKRNQRATKKPPQYRSGQNIRRPGH